MNTWYTIIETHTGKLANGQFIKNLAQTIIPEHRFLRAEGEWSVFRYRDQELFVKTCYLVLAK